MISYLSSEESSWLVKTNEHLIYYYLSSWIMKSNSGLSRYLNEVKTKDGTVFFTPTNIVGVFIFGGSMKVRPIKVSQMDTNYLISLLEQRTSNYGEIMHELKKRLNCVSLKKLLKKWDRVENPILKDLFEVAISERIKNFELVVDYQNYPDPLKKYVEEVKSFDAIWILMHVRNEDILKIARSKCYDFLEEYMDNVDDKVLYELEGDDTYLLLQLPNGIIKFPQEKSEKNKSVINNDEKGKIYQFKKRGGNKK